MCSPDTVAVFVVVVMCIMGCCGVFVWGVCLFGCAYLICSSCKSYKYRKQERKRPRYYDDDVPHPMMNAHPMANAPPMANISQPMPMMTVPTYPSQGTLMVHPIQPAAAGGYWVPSVNEANAHLYHQGTMHSPVSSSSLQANPSFRSASQGFFHGNPMHHYTSNSSHVTQGHDQFYNVNINDSDNDAPPNYDQLQNDYMGGGNDSDDDSLYI